MNYGELSTIMGYYPAIIANHKLLKIDVTEPVVECSKPSAPKNEIYKYKKLQLVTVLFTNNL